MNFEAGTGKPGCAGEELDLPLAGFFIHQHITENPLSIRRGVFLFSRKNNGIGEEIII
jgi:hypothetical protein